MAFSDFASIQYVKTADTGELIRMGGIKPATGIELRHIRVLLYINGVSSLGGSETATMTIYSDFETSKPIFSSSASAINSTTIDNLGSTNWIGFFRFDFAEQNLNPNIIYYPAISISNYTRAADTFFIGVSYDFPAPVYSTLISGNANLFFDHPIGMQVFGNEEINL